MCKVFRKVRARAYIEKRDDVVMRVMSLDELSTRNDDVKRWIEDYWEMINEGNLPEGSDLLVWFMLQTNNWLIDHDMFD